MDGTPRPPPGDAPATRPPATAQAPDEGERPDAVEADFGHDQGLRGLLDRLAQSPHRFGFYQAMRRLEAEFATQPRLGRSARPAEDRLRLCQEPSTIFCPSTLAAFDMDGIDQRPRLSVNFFGLFGPDGPLPLHLTEYARDRTRNWRDPTFQRFADLFHHRALSLFYRAWADARPTVSFDRPWDDRFATYVASLIGLGAAALRGRDAMPDLTKLHFAGHFSNQTRHAEGLALILSAFFAMPVSTHCFIGTWLTLPDSDRTRLGEKPETSGLGHSVLLGARVWSRQDKFRLVFGPLALAQYERLLPGGASLRRLIAIVRNYAGDVLAWDVNMILKEAEVPPTRLGQSGRLGWTTWLGLRKPGTDAADLFLNAGADSLAQAIDTRRRAS
jgi:type VI secretion system protein ImpH